MSYINVLISFFSLSFIIFFHELGHFLFCRFFGVSVEVFSVGFGGDLFSYRDKHNTKWVFGWITIGGYIMPLEKSNEDTPHLIGIEDNHPLKNVLIAFAGPFFNFILAFLIILGVSLTKGIPSMQYEVSYVKSASAADKNGFKVGDTIVDIITDENGRVFEGVKNARVKDGSVVTFIRKGKERKKKIQLNNEKFGGMGYRYSYEKKSFKKSFWFSLMKIFEMIFLALFGIFMVFKSLFLRLIGYGSENMYMNISGTLGIIAVANNCLKNGMADFFVFLASISVSLGAFNLFPIPALDGGQILIYLTEWGVGRKINQKIRDVLFAFSFVLMLCMFVFSTLLDLYKAKII